MGAAVAQRRNRQRRFDRRYVVGSWERKNDIQRGVGRGWESWGRLAQPNAEVTLMASAFGQARIGFAHARAFLSPWIEAEPQRFSITNTSQRASIVDRQTGSSLIARGSDPRRAHGLAPVLALLDEPAQWPPSTANAMLAALTTADGKIPDALFIALGNQTRRP